MADQDPKNPPQEPIQTPGGNEAPDSITRPTVTRKPADGPKQ